MKVGGMFFKNFNKLLKPSFHFTCYLNNSIIVNIYPSLSVPKTTISSPKYFFHSKGFFEAYGNSTRFLLPKFFYKNIVGIKCLLLSNSYKASKDTKDLELKKVFYKKNYLIVNSLVRSGSYGTLAHSFKKSKVSTICSIKSLLLLFFY